MKPRLPLSLVVVLALPGLLVATSFPSWQAANFTPAQLASASVSGATADPDGDGVKNLAEYAFCGLPLSVDSNLATTLQVVDDHLALTYRERQAMADVSIRLQGSDTLKNWITYNTVTEADREAFSGYDEVTLIDPLPFSRKRFVRLRIDLLPLNEPLAPTQLALAVITPSTWALSWTDPNTTETGYAVERRLSTLVWERLVTLDSDIGGWQHTAAYYQTSTTYRVVAIGANTSEAPSTPVTLPDTDQDGIPDALELKGAYAGVAGTFASDPNAFSSNGSGFGDGAQVTSGFNPTQAIETGGDMDGDGVSNALEIARGTEGRDPVAGQDTDHDGISDAEDAVGYDAFFNFSAAPECRYALIDLGADLLKTVNNRGDYVLAHASGGFALVLGGAAPIELSGTCYDLNNRGDMVYRTAADPLPIVTIRHGDGTEENRDYTAYIEETFGKTRVEGKKGPDADGITHYDAIKTVDLTVHPYRLLDNGELGVNISAHYTYLASVDEFEGFYFHGNWVMIDTTSGIILRDTAAVPGTAYTDGDFFNARWTEARTRSFDQAMESDTSLNKSWAATHYMTWANHTDDWAQVPRGDYFICDPHTFDWTFSEGADFIEPTDSDKHASAYTLNAFGRLPGAPGLWKSWSQETSASVLSLGTPAEGRPLLSRRNGDSVVPKHIAANGQMLATGGLWRNGRLQAPAELIADEHWSGLTLTHLNDAGTFLGGRAQKTKDANGETIATPTTHSVLLVPAQLAVDANRDGVIRLASEASPDMTSADQPLRFWSNDDDDDDSGGEEDDFASDTKNCDDNIINGRRDLEDFARLNVYMGGLQDAVVAGTLKIGLKWKNITGGTPAIKVWRNLSPNGGTEYLNDPDVAQEHLALTLPGYVHGTDTYIIPTLFWQQVGLSATQPNGYLLFEGCAEGKGQLVMTILKADGTEIGEGPGVWMDIQQPYKFIERWSCGDVALGPVEYWHRNNDQSGGRGAGEPFATPTKDEEKDYILYVHGYNMKEFEKQRWIETTYKRLYWLGYKGRVGGFTWPGSNSPIPFGDSEDNAWKSADELRKLLIWLKSQGYRVHVLGHSQGNVVVSEALYLAGANSELVSTYIASQAAIAAHCYDATLPDRSGPIAFVPTTPNIYSKYWTNNDSSYLAPAKAQGAALKFVNFYNPLDYALKGNGINLFASDGDQPGWLINERLKPNSPVGYDTQYGFFDNDTGATIPLSLPKDRYRIFSHGVQARSVALGMTSAGGVFSGSEVNLNSAPYNFINEHVYHSGEFRSYYAQRWQYWYAILDACQLSPRANP